MYIERCKHGSEGGLYKPTVEIWQGGTFLPYSYITLNPENWQEHSYVACCGTSIQPVLKMLERVSQLDTVLLCLDNDEAGHVASQRMSAQLADQYSVERLIPENKDWNDDLTAEEEPTFTQVMQ